MTKKSTASIVVGVLVSVALLSASYAQWGGGRRGRMPDRSEFPVWQIDKEFKRDVFTFARAEFDSTRGGYGNRWENDFPDSDWNFSFRLQELTSLQVDPNGVHMRLTDPRLYDYPFLFMNGVGSLLLSQEEADCLRKYLLNGGFLMVDDFWCDGEWANMKEEMEKVLPDRRPMELPLSHEIFHLVYDLKQKPQVPDIRTWNRGSDFEYDHFGSPGDEKPHFQAYHDDHGRMVALMCHNNDLGDGWEREGANEDYFAKYSVPFSYPMGINIITYAMTH